MEVVVPIARIFPSPVWPIIASNLTSLWEVGETLKVNSPWDYLDGKSLLNIIRAKHGTTLKKKSCQDIFVPCLGMGEEMVFRKETFPQHLFVPQERNLMNSTSVGCKKDYRQIEGSPVPISGFYLLHQSTCSSIWIRRFPSYSEGSGILISFSSPII